MAGKIKIQINPADKFGGWTVVRELERDRRGERAFLCRCKCGTERRQQFSNVRYRASDGCNKCRGKEMKALWSRSRRQHLSSWGRFKAFFGFSL